MCSTSDVGMAEPARRIIKSQEGAGRCRVLQHVRTYQGTLHDLGHTFTPKQVVR